MNPLPFSDIHTHRHDAGPDAVICVDPTVTPLPELRPDRHYSVGIHPWQASLATPESLETLAALARRPEVVAIGEAGLDALRGPSLDEVQLPLFERQALLADEVGKPLVVHAVRAWQPLIALHRRLKPGAPWIVHGFRGKPGLARTLVAEGFHISLGPRFNPAVPGVVPPGRLHRETDAT